jgi:hypothetical protein
VKTVYITETEYLEFVEAPRVLHMDMQALVQGDSKARLRFLLSAMVASIHRLHGNWRSMGLPEGYKWGDAWTEDPEELVARRMHLLRHLDLPTMRKITMPCLEVWNSWAEQPDEEQSKNSDGLSDT